MKAFLYCARNPAERERASSEAILRNFVRQLSCPGPGSLSNIDTQSLQHEN